MRDLHELQMHRHGEPVITPPPTDRQLALVEQLIGVQLPIDYVSFLRFSNGGRPMLDTFYIEREGNSEPWTIDHFFSITSDSLATSDTDEVVWQYSSLQPDIPRACLPIASDAFGDILSLDLTREGKGSVIFWVHDEEDWPLFEVAGSFGELIDSLTSYPEDLEEAARLPEERPNSSDN
jgi:hypothetical protein